MIRSGEPLLIEDVRDDALTRAAVDKEHLALYHARSRRSRTSSSRSRRAGGCSGRSRSGPASRAGAFGTTDLELAHEIARRVALAIDNALLFGAAQEPYAQLNTMLVSAPVGIGFWDRDLRFIRVNDALVALNRLAPEEHVGRTLAEVIPTLAPGLEPLYRRVLESGEPLVHTESTDAAALQAGERRHWLSSYYPVRTAEGEVIGVGGVIMEITDRKRADDRLRLLAEAGELFSTSLDQDEIAARIAQVAVPGLADSCNVYLSGEALERVACVNSDPKLRPVLESLPSSFTLDGENAGLLVHAFDSGEPVLLGTIPSEYFEELERLGADPATFDLIGTRSLMLLPIVARGESLGVMTLGSRLAGRFNEHDLDLGQELAHRAAAAMDNARLVLAVADRCGVPHGTVYRFRDLTEEHALEQLRSDFVSTVSHELRTPLAAIYGAAMTLQRDDVALEPAQQQGMLGVIAGESERLARIVNDILVASRLDSGAATVRIGRADASELARAVIAAADTHLPGDVELVLTAPEPGPHVSADPDGLRQVLVNLVENAVKYSPNGGLVELELQQVDGRVRFSVRDRGVGFPVAEHERVFEKFFRLDPNLSRGVGGTGLGVYISRELVRRNGGAGSVSSPSPGAARRSRSSRRSREQNERRPWGRLSLFGLLGRGRPL